jgi:hypothetical protein
MDATEGNGFKHGTSLYSIQQPISIVLFFTLRMHSSYCIG